RIHGLERARVVQTLPKIKHVGVSSLSETNVRSLYYQSGSVWPVSAGDIDVVISFVRRMGMPKVKPEVLAARREEILQAAETCFARQGFHQTTVQDVIRESGLSAGCIYSHFASKEDLIQAIGESRHQRDSALLAADNG